MKQYKSLAVCLIICWLTAAGVMAQRPDYSKLSPMLRTLVRESPQPPNQKKSPRSTLTSHSVCAFVKLAEGGEEALREKGCRMLTRIDDLCIADIPLDRVGALSLDRRILRIEANRSSHTLTDSLARYLNALPVYEGRQLPQAYTGRDVVVGVMDIGFDLTHPTFYSRDTTEYRISRFWDMLSADTVGSRLYVGRDYAGREQLLSVAHARDGLEQYHGTHTAGIAAGSGYDSDYRGMAPESDICLVANAVSDDIAFIDSADIYKFTFATDALGFKYIFDYADSVGRPCVINFSEGSGQDFWGYDLLYYEMLRKLTGPGHIIVSAAGNYGNDLTYLLKEQGRASAGAFFKAWSTSALLTFKSDNAFSIRCVNYNDNGINDTLVVDTRTVLAKEDSVLIAQLANINVLIEAYPSCYDARETCYDVTLKGVRRIGQTVPLSVEILGAEAMVEAYTVGSYFTENTFLNPLLTDGEKSHSILSPAASPDIICVGATYYRPGLINYKGEQKNWALGTPGEWCVNSSVGPTYDGRTKPDVVAPGMYINSAFSSYFLENHPDASETEWDVERFDFNGRTYSWNSQCGTSMASPAVAGAIALWLQAKPDLTAEQVLDVFRHTCKHYDPALDYPNNYYGYGEIDVYAGLLYLLGADRIEGVSTSQSKARVAYSEGRLSVLFDAPLSLPTDVAIYSLAGKKICTATLPANQTAYSLPVPSLPSAVYVVQLSGSSAVAGSVLVAVKP